MLDLDIYYNQDWFRYSSNLGGWMHPPELVWLYQQAQSRQTIVEIGIWLGRSTSALAAGCPGKVLAIDHWQGSPEERETYHAALQDPKLRVGIINQARENLKPFENLTILEMVSTQAVPETLAWLGEQKLGMIFFDGGHDYQSVHDDFVAFDKLLAEDTLVCGHDRHWPGVARAVAERYGSQVQHGPGSIWYFTHYSD